MKIDEESIEIIETPEGSFFAQARLSPTGEIVESKNEYSSERALTRDMAATPSDDFWSWH